MIAFSILRPASALSLGCCLLGSGLLGPALAQEPFNLTSPSIEHNGSLPADLKCTRDGGDGLSPPLAWTDVPEGTQSLAVIMHHYPRGTVEGVDAPSHYWLLWNIPTAIGGLERGNPDSFGDEGADKDMHRTGYTPPCSPPGPTHEYTITVYALSAPLATLPTQDDPSVDWTTMMAAMEGLVLASSDLNFAN